MFLPPLPYNTVFGIAGKSKRGRIGPILSSPFFKVAHALLRFDHVASVIINTNHGMM